MEFTGKVVKIDGKICFEPSNYIDKNKCLEEFEHGEVYKFKTSKPRSNKQHGYFYAFLDVAVDLGMLEREYVFWDILNVNQKFIQSQILMFKDHSHVFRRILALAFLPFDTMVDAFGREHSGLGSISFKARDSEQFTVFLNKCIDFVCSECKISQKELDMMIRRVEE